MNEQELTELAAGLDAQIDELASSMHPAVAGVLQFFKCSHLPPRLRATSAMVGSTAIGMCKTPDMQGAELTVGLRKLLEAKDCFVRAMVATR